MNTQHYFDERSQEWETLYAEDARFARRFERITTLIRRVAGGRIGHALDAGCGSGIFSRYLAESGWQVTAIDASRDMVARAKNASDSLDIGYSVSTVEKFIAPSRSFDLIISLSVLEYAEDDEVALDRLISLLKPGGILILSVPNRVGLVRKLERIIFGIRSVTRNRVFGGRGEYLKYQKHQYSPFELDLMVRQMGLRKRSSLYLNPVVSGPDWLLPLLERRWWAAMYCAAYQSIKGDVPGA